MGLTLVEKVLARTSNTPAVKPGDVVFASPDLVVAHETNFHVGIEQIDLIGVERIFDPTRMIAIIDHDIPGVNAHSVELKKKTRRLAKEQGVRLYDVGRQGISHQLPAESGDVRPGMFVATSDIHSTTLGGLGAIVIPISRDIRSVYATGESWFRVPATIRINLSGELQSWMTSRDVAQWILGKIDPDDADYRVIEFGGPLIDTMDIDGRMTLCNVMVELGVKTAVVPPDETTFAYVRERTGATFEPVWSDADAEYERVLAFDVGGIGPHVGMPPSPDNIHPIAEALGVKVNQAYIGSCAGGRMEDLRIAARVLAGRQIHPDVRLLVVPTSQQIFADAAAEGLVEQFVRAGALFMNSTCGPCYGKQAMLAAGETCIATSTRNDRGRMGSTEASIYLGGPSTVAASAVKGEIADPREFV
jgi:3-isopropylmalate/(R)-2-methylmalate dehydratase large subunit